MCLSVYLGTSRPVTLPEALPGNLGIELASWTPSPLRERHAHVYYLGRKGERPKLECSCLLAEYVDWTEQGAIVTSDGLYPEEGPCPFERLRELCAAALGDGGWATIVCDDSGGEKITLDVGCYDQSYVRLEHIARGSLLFAENNGCIPCRALSVVK